MGRKIGIIGIGNVGAAIAHGLITQGVFDEYVLIDTNEKKVNADALDFKDAAANLKYPAHIVVNDYDALANADVVVLSFGKIALQDNPNADRFAELSFTSTQVPDISEKLKTSGFNGIVVVISNPVDVITSLVQYHTQFPKNRVIGTGTLLDTARMKRAVAAHFNIDPRSVYGYNLGEHGNSQFTAWSQVRVKGQPIEKCVDKPLLETIAYEALSGGHTVFHGKKYTNYGIASATIRLVQAIVSNSHEELPVSHYHDKFDTYLSTPAIIGRDGIIDKVHLNLSAEETEKLHASAEYIKQKFSEHIPVTSKS